MPIPTSEQFDAYAAAPSLLVASIHGLSDTSMHHKPTEDEWSIHEVVIHLADSEAGGFWRLRQTIVEPESTLAVYDEDAWAKKLSYNSQDRALAITLFAAQRASTVALLRSLPAETWERTSVHPERGIMSLYDVFILYLKHGTIHLQQIERLKQSFEAHTPKK